MATLEERIAELEARIAALEKKVDSQTAANGNDEPSGRFASIGAISHYVSQDSTVKPVDFSSLPGAKVVRKAQR